MLFYINNNLKYYSNEYNINMEYVNMNDLLKSTKQNNNLLMLRMGYNTITRFALHKSEVSVYWEI